MRAPPADLLSRALSCGIDTREKKGNRAAQVMSTLSAAMAIIPMVAPSIGALILEFADWPAVFIALAVFAGLVLVALSRLPETTSNSSGERLTLLTIIRSFSEMLRTPAQLSRLPNGGLLLLFSAICISIDGGVFLTSPRCFQHTDLSIRLCVRADGFRLHDR